MEASSNLLSWLEEDTAEIDTLMAGSEQDEVWLLEVHETKKSFYFLFFTNIVLMLTVLYS